MLDKPPATAYSATKMATSQWGKMTMNFSENDLSVVTQIQELTGASVAKAKELFRQTANQLANPDVEGRHDLVLDNIKTRLEKGELTVVAPKAPKKTRNEKRLERKEKKAAKKTAKTAKAKKADGPRKPRKSSVTRIDWPYVTPEREVQLTPASVPNVYTAVLFGRKHACILHEVNYERGVIARGTWLQISPKRFDAAVEYGKAENLPVAICASVRIKGKLDQGYAIPEAAFEQFKMKKHHGMKMNGEARKAYSEQGWDGVKFNIKKVDEEIAA
jgi:hypothetical protein